MTNSTVEKLTPTRVKLSVAFTAGPKSLERVGRSIRVTLKPTVAVSSALDGFDGPVEPPAITVIGAVAGFRA